MIKRIYHIVHHSFYVRKWSPTFFPKYRMKILKIKKMDLCKHLSSLISIDNRGIMSFSIMLTICSLSILSACTTKKPNEIVNAEKLLPEVIDFNFHVKPILSDKCYACHGPDLSKQKANLRLDTKEGAYSALGDNDARHAIVPGNLDKSMVFERLISTDPESIMPPPSFHLKLSDLEIAIIAKWIEQGAEYKPHWSFIPLTEVKIPELSNKFKTKHPIDNFIIKRLLAENMRPSGEASKETLIRRVSFDITGLPPSLSEIDYFVQDETPDAYEKLVNRLLASDAYGERMAANWMDVARYADSDGYLDDKHREFAPWRDWVIQSFNQNMSYDKFTTLQLAGDLIPEVNQESILATAFNRLNKRNSEAGIIFEEFRVEYAADRTHTLGKAFMGLSIECARCHDHKYDPISQKDYYQLFGFFNSTFEIGSPVYGPDQTPGPSLLLSSKQEQEQITLLKNMIKAQEQIIKEIKTDDTLFEKWISEHPITVKELKENLKKSLTAHYAFDTFNTHSEKVMVSSRDGSELKAKNTTKFKTPNRLDPSLPSVITEPIIKPGISGNALFISDYNSGNLGEKIGWYERTDPFSIELWVKPDTIYPEAAILWHSEHRQLGLKGYSLTLKDNKIEFILAHSHPHNAIQVISSKKLVPKKWSRLTITYDGSSKAAGVTIYINGVNQYLITEQDNLYKTILFQYDQSLAQLGFVFNGLSFGSRDKFGPFKNGGIDELKIYDSELTPLEVLYTFNEKEALSILEKSGSEKYLKEYFFAHYDHDKNRVEKELKEIRTKENELLSGIKEIMVMGELPEPRPTYILNRGVYSEKGEQVEPGTPKSIMAFDPLLPSNRLGLSRWLFDEKNPLTARVFVNRIWQMHFGTGLVSTANDFGSQGSIPSHPALLDWLSNRFIESDWDIKALHKLILTSSTYKQKSILTKESLERDPENILLARGPRIRLPAEMIRDNALAISELLVKKIGGVSVYPYQPEGVWEPGWFYEYLQEPGEGLYRRSLYTFWKRGAPPPSMMIFDIADRDVCTVKRTISNTPLQALVLLNDPQYVEASRVLAENIIRKEKNKKQRLNAAFRITTGRMPDQKEENIINTFYDGELVNFRENKEKALAFLKTGNKKWDKNLNPTEIAALAVVVNSIMNTNEVFTKN